MINRKACPIIGRAGFFMISLVSVPEKDGG